MIQTKSQQRRSRFLMDIVFILISAVCVVPLLLIVSAAFTDEQALFRNGYQFWPSEFSLEAFKFVFQSPKQIFTAYGVTIFVTVFGTVVSLLFTSMLAYVATRKDCRASRPISFLIFFALLFNGGMVPTYIMITKYFHLKDTIWSMILPYIIMPWHVFLMKGFFSDIPTSLIEAAKIDGASEVRTFFKVILPISKPALATVGLFIAFTYWNDWWLSMLYVENPNLTSLQYYLYRIMNNIQFLSSSLQSGNININIANLPSETARMALCLVAAGPMLVSFPFFQKYFVKGLTVGAVKG